MLIKNTRGLNLIKAGKNIICEIAASFILQKSTRSQLDTTLLIANTAIFVIILKLKTKKVVTIQE
ncbi:hypothetical protein GCM10025879_02530 [Leuconostoc litchii]|nr:hypothetical protein GCM10025879_02530 [Leuconostoc litchii]